MSEQDTVEVRDAPEECRYEARLGGALAGYAEYHRDGDHVVFTHTKVLDDFEGEGVGSALARAALDDVRGKGEQVVPQCEFIKGYIDKHAEYQDLVAG